MNSEPPDLLRVRVEPSMVEGLTSDELGALDPHCVITRLQFQRYRHYWAAIIRFRKLRRVGRSKIRGMLLSELMMHHSRKEIVILSLWPSQYELLAFTTLSEHSHAVRWCFRVEAQISSNVFHLLGRSSRGDDWLGDTTWRPAIQDWSQLRDWAPSQ